LLDDVEQGRAQAMTGAFNTILRKKAAAKGLAFFDAYSYFNDIAANGLATNGTNNTTAYISGNLFSLDGVHPSPHGYAVIANELLRLINAQYGSSLSPVDPNRYRAVRLP
jgi:lysophospholipase L1-like esterase